MSHFLYIHKDMSGTPDVWKPGIAMLPYSAVRARQKFTWNQFELNYLFFGRPRNIVFLENSIKSYFSHCSGKTLQGFGGQTELFQVKEQDLLLYIRTTIQQHDLAIKEVLLEKPYTASNSEQCPFNCPPEAYARSWCDQKAVELFGQDSYRTAKDMFSELFGVDQ
jgi:hypothetical protein